MAGPVCSGRDVGGVGGGRAELGARFSWAAVNHHDTGHANTQVTATLRARTKERRRLGLAHEVRRGVLQFEPGWRDWLEAMELHLDIRKPPMAERPLASNSRSVRGVERLVPRLGQSAFNGGGCCTLHQCLAGRRVNTAGFLDGGRQAFSAQTFADDSLQGFQVLAGNLGPQAVLNAATECFGLSCEHAGRLGIHSTARRLERLPAEIERTLLHGLQVGCFAAGCEHQRETGHQNSPHRVFPLSVFVRSPGQPQGREPA
jgi:hypothetical protein